MLSRENVPSRQGLFSKTYSPREDYPQWETTGTNIHIAHQKNVLCSDLPRLFIAIYALKRSFQELNIILGLKIVQARSVEVSNKAGNPRCAGRSAHRFE